MKISSLPIIRRIYESFQFHVVMPTKLRRRHEENMKKENERTARIEDLARGDYCESTRAFLAGEYERCEYFRERADKILTTEARRHTQAVITSLKNSSFL